MTYEVNVFYKKGDDEYWESDSEHYTLKEAEERLAEINGDLIGSVNEDGYEAIEAEIYKWKTL